MNADGSVRNLFTCLPLQKIKLTKLWAQFGFFSSKDKWLCFECKDVSKSNDARQSHYLQRLQVHYCGDWWPLGQQHIRKTGKWRLGEWVCVFYCSSAYQPPWHCGGARPRQPGTGPHPLYNRRPGSGAPVQCRYSYWQHRLGHPHHLGGDKYFLMVQIFSECGVLGWPQQLDTPLQYHAYQ